MLAQLTFAAVLIAQSSPNEAIFRGRHHDADPNAPRFEFVWRGAPRGKFAGLIPLIKFGEDHEFRFNITPLVELYNSTRTGGLVPFEYWRGRIGGELSFGGRWWRERLKAIEYQVRIGAEHESAHETDNEGSDTLIFIGQRGASVSNFVAYNNVLLALSVAYPFWHTTWTLTSIHRVHFASCNDSDRCVPGKGSTSYEWAFSLTGETEPFSLGTLAPRIYLAFFFGELLPAAQLDRERRFAAQVGVAVKAPIWGAIRLFGSMQLGQALGLLFRRSETQLGLGLAYNF